MTDCDLKSVSNHFSAETNRHREAVWNRARKEGRQMFRTLEEHAERFYGKRSGPLAPIVRLKMLVFGSVLAIGTVLSILVTLD
jgi:hypothetical protein